MKWIKEKLIYIVLIFINFNFILLVLDEGMLIESFDYKFTSMLFLAGVLIYWFYNYVLKNKILRFSFTTIILIAIGVLCYVNFDIVSNIFEDNINNITALNDLIFNGEITNFYQYKNIFTLIIPLVTTLILWITFRFVKKFILILSLAVVISLWFSSSSFVVKENMFAYLFISLMTFIIMNYITKMHYYKEKGVKTTLKSGYVLIYGVIISLIIAKLVIALPQEYKGKNLSMFGNYFKNEFVEDENSPMDGKYRIASSGYSSNSGKLGGPISINNQEVFKVKSDKSYYLKGNVESFYDGYKWDNLNDNYIITFSKQYIGNPRLAGVTDLSNISGKSMTIYPHQKFKTNTVFVPNYAVMVTGVEGKLLYDGAPTVLSEKMVSKEYTVHFFDGVEEFSTIENANNFQKRILENAEPKDPLTGEPVLIMNYFLQPKISRVNEGNNEKLSLVDSFEYKKIEDSLIVEEYSEYLQVPENITNRTRDLVRNITKDSKTSLEKVLAIKEYLTKNHVYALDVTVVPDGVEFIDYFLFQEKRGYCTYFNTAMTVMCRMAGVPARYVEGFKTPSLPDERIDQYVVSNADAHAWCEVLMGDGFWTVADASPTASEDEKKKIEERNKAERDTGANEEVDKNKAPKQKNDKNLEGPDQGDYVGKSKMLSDSDINKIKIVTTILLFMLIRIMQVYKRRKTVLESHGITQLYNYYLYRLATISIVKENYIGDLEFVKAMQDSTLKVRIETLVKGSYEEFYGKHSVETLNNKEYYKFLESYLKDRQGRIEYLLNKYLGG